MLDKRYLNMSSSVNKNFVIIIIIISQSDSVSTQSAVRNNQPNNDRSARDLLCVFVAS